MKGRQMFVLIGGLAASAHGARMNGEQLLQSQSEMSQSALQHSIFPQGSIYMSAQSGQSGQHGLLESSLAALQNSQRVMPAFEEQEIFVPQQPPQVQQQQGLQHSQVGVQEHQQEPEPQYEHLEYLPGRMPFERGCERFGRSEFEKRARCLLVEIRVKESEVFEALQERVRGFWTLLGLQGAAKTGEGLSLIGEKTGSWSKQLGLGLKGTIPEGVKEKAKGYGQLTSETASSVWEWMQKKYYGGEVAYEEEQQKRQELAAQAAQKSAEIAHKRALRKLEGAMVPEALMKFMTELCKVMSSNAEIKAMLKMMLVTEKYWSK